MIVSHFFHYGIIALSFCYNKYHPDTKGFHELQILFENLLCETTSILEGDEKMTTHEKICDAVSMTADKYNIKTAYYFGSYAAGRQTEKSDIDLLVEFHNPFVSLFAISNLSFELEARLNISVDIISLPLPNDTHLVIGKRVQRYGE